jgi:hypothetical protein
MADAATEYPPLASRVGKRGTARKPSGATFHWVVEDEIRLEHRGLPTMRICFERIRFEENGRVEIRLGYYMIGEKPRMKGKWVWGQYSPMMPIEDFKLLIDEATARGWFNPQP